MSANKDEVQQEEQLEDQKVHEGVIEPEAKEQETAEAEPQVEAGGDDAEVDLQAAFDAKQEELDQLQDKYLRTCAELENLRKRGQRDVTDARKFAIEKFAGSLLSIGDNLERALEVDAQDAAAIREGIELTLKTWADRLEENGIQRVEAVGKTFDPHMHEALGKMPSDEDEDTVVMQHTVGYTLNERLLRPAQVMVSSGKA
ncbi:MAG: nucleotide exchange factor GrpE [Mariprofundaceae bacterium]|nr:nucleotide exchange factor GrpE [Mariprofundaceae bacterium]